MATLPPSADHPGPPRVTVEVWPDLVVVRPAGDLDLNTASLLAQVLKGHLDGGSTLLIDASGIDFIDCSGLRVLLEARRANPDLALAVPSAAVRRLLDILGLSFPVIDDPRGLLSTDTPDTRPVDTPH